MSLLKKMLCLVLSLMLVIPGMGLADDNAPAGAAETAEAGETATREYPDELIVSHPTITKGDFFTEMFGNDTADIDVRALIHGYNLVNWDQNQGVYVLDPTVVTEYKVVDDELGNRTYFLAIADDLYYSDGTPITAWDYAFSILLMMAPEVEQIGGKIYRAQHLLGYDEYITGQADSLSGVEVLGDHQLAITLDHDFLPYFFEVGLLLTVPYPIHVIAPGCKVYDDGDGYGVYIGNADKSVTEKQFTPELLKKTILDPETGYNSHPSVVSGPYIMTSYDGVTSHFEINPYFKGAWFHNTLPGGNAAAMYTPMLDENNEQRLDSAGNPMYLVKPSIQKIAFTVAENETVIGKIADGELHLVNKITYGPTIIEGMNGGKPGEEKAENIRFQAYPRIGLAFLTFTYDWPTVHDKEVRQAIAWCMDRDQLTADYCGAALPVPEGAEPGTEPQLMNFGVRVDGYFGIEQWEYLLVTHQMQGPVNMIDEVLPEVHTPEDEENLLKHKNRYVRTQEEFDAALAAWDALNLDNLTVYKVDVDKANALLDNAGWTLNEQGEAYRPGVDEVRCKMVDGKLVPLRLKMMYPEGNHIVDTLQVNFIDNLNKAGITLELVPAPMQELLKSYYRQTDRTTDMIYLATNFHVVVDPSITYSTDTSLNHKIWNNTYSDDELLFQLAVSMRKTDPMDVFDYVTKWVAFQERYNEVLPTIPIYSNIYYDFYTDMLQNYYITGQVTWSQAIILAYFGEEAEAAAPAEEDAGADDTETFED